MDLVVRMIGRPAGAIAEGPGDGGQDGFDFASTPKLDRLWNRPAWAKAVEMTLSGGR